MAKNKKKPAATSQGKQDDPVEVKKAECEAPLTAAPEASLAEERTALVESSGQDPEELISILRQRNEQFERELKAKDEIIASLQAALKEREKSESAVCQPSSSIPVEGINLDEIKKLQEKLVQLRKEQSEADATKEAAWKQLKGAIQEISKVAQAEQPTHL